MPDTEARIRAGLHTYAGTMSVPRPSVGELLASAEGHRRSPGPLRPILAVAAVVLAVAGAVVLLRGPEAQVTADAPAAPVVWPLGGDVSVDVLRTPATAAEAYVHTVLGLSSQWHNEGDSARDGRSANEYFVREADGRTSDGVRVWLVEIDGLWFVTSARSDDGPQILQARTEGENVRLEAVLIGDPALGRESDRLFAELRATDGTVLDQQEVVMDDGLWRADLSIGAGEEAAAVLVRQDGGTAPAYASGLVLPAEAADHPMKSLFPAATASYYDAWNYTSTHPDDPLADWQAATTSLVEAAGNGTPANPSYDQVVERPDGFTMAGRFRTDDGGAGTFELVRLRLDGPWFVLSLKDDAIEVRDTSVTASAVEVELVVREDYTLAVGQLLEPATAFGQGGAATVFAQELTPATPMAGLFQVYAAADDGSLLRYSDAWGPAD